VKDNFYALIAMSAVGRLPNERVNTDDPKGDGYVYRKGATERERGIARRRTRRKRAKKK
jgi:hypothetical protein